MPNYYKPMDSVGPIAASRKPTMGHALNMINAAPAEAQYEGHGNVETGMPDENLMRRAVQCLNKNPR